MRITKRHRAVGWKLVAIGLAIALTGCPSVKVMPTDLVAGIDPPIDWDAVTTTCDNKPVAGVRYNVFIVSGPGPVPTITTPQIGCPANITKPNGIAPVNAAPLTVPHYDAILPVGQYTVVVQGINAQGDVGGLSAPLTFRVIDSPSAPANVRVSWVQ